MAKWQLKLVTPAIVKRTVTPRRLPNGKLRTREYMTEAEVERLMKAAGRNRHGHRDATMVLVAYRHGLRASELVDLRWSQVEFGTAALHVRRVKQGTPSTHPILGDELRALRRLQREQEPRSPTCSPPSAARRSPRLASLAWSSEPGLRPSSGSSRTRICCVMLADTRWPIRGTTHAPCKPTSATRTFSTR
jgi:integrase